MSSGKEPPASTDGDHLEESSPTDTPTPPRRFEPITHGEDENEPGNTQGTVRRSRPAHITTNTGIPNYGVFLGLCGTLSLGV